MPVALATAALRRHPAHLPRRAATRSPSCAGTRANGGRPKVNWAAPGAHSTAPSCCVRRTGRTARASSSGLIAHGRPDDDRAALVLHAARSPARRRSSARSPTWRPGWTGALDGSASLVVGKVVGLRDHLRWFDERPLFGRRVLVTARAIRPGNWSSCSKAPAPKPSRRRCCAVAAARVFEALDTATDAVAGFDWIIFTTVNGVEGFLHRLIERGRDARALAGPRLCAAWAWARGRTAGPLRHPRRPGPRGPGRRECHRGAGRRRGGDRTARAHAVIGRRPRHAR